MQTSRGGSTSNHMAHKRAQDLPLLLLHEQRQWLRGAVNNVSEEATEFAIMYSRGLHDLGDFELRAQGKQTPEQRLKKIRIFVS